MKSLALRFFLAVATLSALSSCKTADPEGAATSPPAGSAYGNPPGYQGRTGGYPSDSDYVQVAPVPQGGNSAYQAPKYPKAADSPAPSGGSSYTVQKGDTLYGISRRNSTSVSALKSANNLTNDTIRPGQVLRIP